MTSKPLYTSETIDLSYQFLNGCIDIEMLVKNDITNTRDLPKTYNILHAYLPSVLRTQCFNSQNLPFWQKVKQTQLGHLFEHILIEYMALGKLEYANKSEFEAVTKWNWVTNPRGSFNIKIPLYIFDWPIFINSLPKALFLTEKILASDIEKEIRVGSRPPQFLFKLNAAQHQL